MFVYILDNSTDDTVKVSASRQVEKRRGKVKTEAKTCWIHLENWGKGYGGKESQNTTVYTVFVLCLFFRKKIVDAVRNKQTFIEYLFVS